MALVIVSSERNIEGIEFFSETVSDSADYGQINAAMPAGFGDGEFTFTMVIRPDDAYSFGLTDSTPGKRTNWASEDVTPYSASNWWYRGNFLLDMFSLGSFYAGTFALQFYGSGRLRWLFGDGNATGAAGQQVGDVWTVQAATTGSTPNIVDGNRHYVSCVRRWQSSPANSADLELWIDGVLIGTTNSAVRLDMAATYWDAVVNGGMYFGSEKQAAAGTLADYEDYKGPIGEVAFYSGALSVSELQNNYSDVVNTGHADYADHFDFSEQSGNSTVSNNSLTMNLYSDSNPSVAGGQWVSNV